MLDTPLCGALLKVFSLRADLQLLLFTGLFGLFFAAASAFAAPDKSGVYLTLLLEFALQCVLRGGMKGKFSRERPFRRRGCPQSLVRT